MNRIAPLRNSRAMASKSKSPKKYLTGYDAGHALTEEYNSAQKDKQVHGYRRDYSTDSLVKYTSQNGSAIKDHPLSPFKTSPMKHQPMRQSMGSIENLDQPHIDQNLAMKYYSSNHAYKKGSSGYQSQPYQSHLPQSKENQAIRIQENYSSDRYRRDYKNFHTRPQTTSVNQGKNSVMMRLDQMSKTSWEPEDSVSDNQTVTTGFDGMTQAFGGSQFTTEKRMQRSSSFATPSAVTLKKQHRKLLFPVVKCFHEQIKILREIEQLKLNLAQSQDFNLPDLYKMFSINKQVTMAKHEFVKGCQIFGIITKNKEKLEAIFNRHQRNNKLTFDQFSAIFLPFDRDTYEDVVNRRPIYNKTFPKDKTKVFKQVTNKSIITLIARLVKAELQYKALQKHVNANVDDPQRIFHLLSTNGMNLPLKTQKSILKNNCKKHNPTFKSIDDDAVCT